MPSPPMYIGNHHHRQHRQQQEQSLKSPAAVIYQCTEEDCSCTAAAMTTTANNDINNNNNNNGSDVMNEKDRQRSYRLETRKRTLDAVMMGGHVISARGEEGGRADNIMTSSKIRDAHADYLTYLKSVKELKKIEKMNNMNSATTTPFGFGGSGKKGMVSV